VAQGLPPFVNAVEGGAVTPRQGAGRAGQCVAGCTGGCRPSIALGSARRCSEPRSAPTLATGSKGSTASPRRRLPGFEGAESLWLERLTVLQASPANAGETSPRRPERRTPGPPRTDSSAYRSPASRTARDAKATASLPRRRRRSCRAPRSPTPYPSGTGDRRLSLPILEIPA